MLLFTKDLSLRHLFTVSALVLPLLALYEIYNWSRNDWKYHPISLNVNKFCNSNSDWRSVASDISAEYRRYFISN